MAQPVGASSAPRWVPGFMRSHGQDTAGFPVMARGFR